MKINEEMTKKLITEMIQASDKAEEREEKLLELGITIDIYSGIDTFFDTLFDEKAGSEEIWEIVLDRNKSIEERAEILIDIYDKQD